MAKESSLDVYYVFGAVSIVCSLYVIASILQFGYETSPTKLILCLHLTVIIENITTFPDLFTGNDGLCSFLGFLRTYFGFANAIVVFMIVFHYRYIFIVDSWKIKDLVSRRREWIIFLAPMITILPFFTNGYGEDRSIWCSIKQNDRVNDTWSFAVYYGWIISIIALSAFLMLHTIIQVYLADPTIASSLVKSIGLYAVISILSWFPRFLARFGTISPINGNIFLYFSGIAYLITFVSERESLKAFEENARFTLAENSENGDAYISWHFDSAYFRNFSKSDDGLTPRSSMGKKSPTMQSHQSRSLIARSIQKIGAMFSGAGTSTSANSKIANSGPSSAHSSANRGEISPIQPNEEVHNIMLDEPLTNPSQSPPPTAAAPVQHRNRPISANLVSIIANNPINPNTSNNVNTNNSASGSANVSSSDQNTRRSGLINYNNIAKYNMNIDEPIARSRPASYRQTPAKMHRESDVESGRGHAPDSERKRPQSMKVGRSQNNNSAVNQPEPPKRPSSLRLNAIGGKTEDASTSAQNANLIEGTGAGGKEMKMTLDRTYKTEVTTIKEEEREDNSESSQHKPSGSDISNV